MCKANVLLSVGNAIIYLGNESNKNVWNVLCHDFKKNFLSGHCLDQDQGHQLDDLLGVDPGQGHHIEMKDIVIGPDVLTWYQRGSSSVIYHMKWSGKTSRIYLEKKVCFFCLSQVKNWGTLQFNQLLLSISPEYSNDFLQI